MQNCDLLNIKIPNIKKSASANTKFLKIVSLSVVFLMIVGCGFHLRGKVNIPEFLRVLRISPDIPSDPLQKALRQALKGNQVIVYRENDPKACDAAIISILSQSIAERNVAYGVDGQANRSMVQLTIHYRITDKNGKVILPNGRVRVERSLTIIPNAVLGTENERNRVMRELYDDGALQLLRQLSLLGVKL